MGDDAGSSRVSWLLAGTLAFGSVLGCLGLALQPPNTGLVAAVFPPWWGATRSVLAAAASGSILGLGRFGFVVVVSRDAGATPWPRGAWLTVDPRAFGGCLIDRAVLRG